MKTFLIIAATTIGCASGAFVPSSSTFVAQKQQIALGSSIRAEDFMDKPLTPKGQKSTPSKAVRPVSWIEKQTKEDVMIEPDYYLSWAMAALGFLIMWYHPSYDPAGGPSLVGIAGGCFHILFGALLWVQTRRVRCVFEKDAFEFYNIKGTSLDLEKGAYLQAKPGNYVTGTTNRWNYDTITNWGFFPSLEYPVICYFKETETPEEQWDKWFAAFDSYGRGQPHFFPGILNVKQFKEQLEARGVKRKEIPTFKK
mmetsp:Transcript_17557/g.26023  ORF Transcript_17557/g.26023 Transcript_17557/m.26023 type:complete len:254 (-) Transcript_17557:321-1082(-)|eukprot:CAMPEP_0194047388 /NCGR_PEP_ID=MMETSP0009_2-20130614/24409_1 /TAXON_ID=210454 /ORGANISM="Grammatophora oceanica, Strain CCMP 410" /LENGTH=253 /DNA_ID=CAMNT_0038692995 /DNA_START=35 /DNA_END=796 /DNA_ORIENTATION=+